MRQRPSLRTAVAITITVVWATSYIGAMATSNYTGFEVCTPVMLIVATYLLGHDIIRRNGGS